jgi:hypothetical protein
VGKASCTDKSNLCPIYPIWHIEYEGHSLFWQFQSTKVVYDNLSHSSERLGQFHPDELPYQLPPTSATLFFKASKLRVFLLVDHEDLSDALYIIALAEDTDGLNAIFPGAITNNAIEGMKLIHKFTRQMNP